MDCTIFEFTLQNNYGYFSSFRFKIKKKTYFKIITYNFDLTKCQSLFPSLQFFPWSFVLKVKCFDVISTVIVFHVQDDIIMKNKACLREVKKNLNQFLKTFFYRNIGKLNIFFFSLFKNSSYLTMSLLYQVTQAYSTLFESSYNYTNYCFNIAYPITNNKMHLFLCIYIPCLIFGIMG